LKKKIVAEKEMNKYTHLFVELELFCQLWNRVQGRIFLEGGQDLLSLVQAVKTGGRGIVIIEKKFHSSDKIDSKSNLSDHFQGFTTYYHYNYHLNFAQFW
jgi:hypothetical protein